MNKVDMDMEQMNKKCFGKRLKQRIVRFICIGFIGGLSLTTSHAALFNPDNDTSSNARDTAKSGEQSKMLVPSNDRETPDMMPDYNKAALINVELGLGYLSQGQVARAKTKLTHALKLAPKLAEAHSAMAYFSEMVSDFKNAEQEHKKAVRLSAGKGAVYNNYGAFLCRRARYKEADDAFQYAVQDKDYPRTAEVYENAGLCALKWPESANSEIKAAEYLTTAIQRDPNRSSAVLELAALNLKQGKLEEANALLDRYQTVAEPNARALWLGVQVAQGLKDIENAKLKASQLKKLFQDSPEYQQYLAAENQKSKSRKK